MSEPLNAGENWLSEGWIDLGHEHSYKPLRHAQLERYGLVVKHKKPDGSDCWGSVRFDTPEMRALEPGRVPGWKVEFWDPLTISPSLQCSCGDHGWIRGGKWVPA